MQGCLQASVTQSRQSLTMVLVFSVALSMSRGEAENEARQNPQHREHRGCNQFECSFLEPLGEHCGRGPFTRVSHLRILKPRLAARPSCDA